MAHSVDLEQAGSVATITMANPPRHTMTAAMVGELDAITSGLAQDDTVRVVVLTGGGDGVFVRHYEVGELADTSERQRGASSARTGSRRPPQLHPFNRIMRRLESMPKITIAAINGMAMGGGCELAMSCDFRLMADGEHPFGLPETSVGIIPGAGGTQRFARVLGTAKALDLILHAHVMTPTDALGLGLVHRVFPAATFVADVADFVNDLAARAPIALAAAKRAILDGVTMSIDDGLLLEQEMFGRCMRSADAAGALRASLAGEPYTFEGK